MRGSRWSGHIRAWEDLRWGTPATNPASAVREHRMSTTREAWGRLATTDGVRAQWRCTACTPVGRGPVHMAIRQFLPSSIRCGVRRVCQKDAWAAKLQDVFRRPRCCGFVVAAKRGVVIRGWLWSGNTVHPAGGGEVVCGLRRPWTSGTANVWHLW